ADVWPPLRVSPCLLAVNTFTVNQSPLLHCTWKDECFPPLVPLDQVSLQLVIAAKITTAPSSWFMMKTVDVTSLSSCMIKSSLMSSLRHTLHPETPLEKPKGLSHCIFHYPLRPLPYSDTDSDRKQINSLRKLSILSRVWHLCLASGKEIAFVLKSLGIASSCQPLTVKDVFL
ncbi:hypothetical protein STEG23_026022, partial [Scotinomys teguina]